MTTSKVIFENIRAVLEIGYYVAGISLAYLAYRGLAQIKLTKELASTNAKREAFKLAVEECRYYAEQVVPARAALIEVAKTKRITFLPAVSFKLVKGEITDVVTPGRDIAAEGVTLNQDLLLYMNRVEAFAMAFTSGVADEMVAYRETARAFCQTLPETAPFINIMRERGIARYDSTIQLFELWHHRLSSEALTKQKEMIDQAAERVKGAQPPKIKTIGTE